VLPATWSLCSVDSTSTVKTAFTILREKNLYAVPVWDVDKAQHVGFFGAGDLVHFLVQLFANKASLAHSDHPDDEVQLLTETVFSESELEALRDQFFNHPIAELINVSQQNPWKPMSAESSLQEVLNTLIQEKISRLPLVDKNGKVVAIISESGIIRFLASHLDKLGNLSNKTLGDSIVPRPIEVHSVLTEKTIVSFAKLARHKITHLALNPGGTPHGTLSLKDIKAAGEFNWLVSPVGDFVAHVRQQNLKSVHPYMHLNTSDLLGRTICRFEATGVHMMYLTSLPTQVLDKTASYPPVGLVTLHDLLAPFSTNP